MDLIILRERDIQSIKEIPKGKPKLQNQQECREARNLAKVKGTIVRESP